MKAVLEADTGIAVLADVCVHKVQLFLAPRDWASGLLVDSGIVAGLAIL